MSNLVIRFIAILAIFIFLTIPISMSSGDSSKGTMSSGDSSKGTMSSGLLPGPEDADDNQSAGVASEDNSNANKNSNKKTIDIGVKFDKGKNNIFVENKKDYRVTEFNIDFINNSEICQSNNCEYVFNNGEFVPGMMETGSYLLTGRLKVSESIDDATKSEFYKVFANLGLIEEETTGKKTTKLYGGTLNLDAGRYDIQYDITNATLVLNNDKNPTLTLQGEG